MKIIFIIYIITSIIDVYSLSCKEVPTGYCLMVNEFEDSMNLFASLAQEFPDKKSKIEESNKNYNTIMNAASNVEIDIDTLKYYRSCMDNILSKRNSDSWNLIENHYNSHLPNIDILCKEDSKKIRHYQNNSTCEIPQIQSAGWSWLPKIWNIFVKTPKPTGKAIDTHRMITNALQKPKLWFYGGSTLFGGGLIAGVIIIDGLENNTKINELNDKAKEKQSQYNSLMQTCIKEKNEVSARHDVITGVINEVLIQ